MENRQTKLTLIGHASTKIITKSGLVIYIDPFYKGDYTETADIILVTHGHGDHCQVRMIPTSKNTITITYKEALKDMEYQSFQVGEISIEAVPAYNEHHDRKESVGYILSFDDISVYHAGDTSKIEEMNNLKDKNLTYAMLPIDNFYNMGPIEATEAAEMIGAKYNIPIHTAPDGKPLDEKNVNQFTPKGRLIVKYGETITLTE